MEIKKDLEILMDLLAIEINRYNGEKKREEKVTQMAHGYFTYQKRYKLLFGNDYACPYSGGRLWVLDLDELRRRGL